MGKGEEIPKTNPAEFEAVIARVKQWAPAHRKLMADRAKQGCDVIDQRAIIKMLEIAIRLVAI